jgi:hypothetical protein
MPVVVVVERMKELRVLVARVVEETENLIFLHHQKMVTPVWQILAVGAEEQQLPTTLEEMAGPEWLLLHIKTYTPIWQQLLA